MMGAVALLLLIAGEPVVPPSSTIAFVRANPERFDGHRVQLRGWIPQECQLACALVDPAGPKGQQSLSIGEDEEFDRLINDWAPAEVILEGRFSTVCMRPGIICTDRAPDLTDVRLIRVLREGPMPRKQGN